MVNARSCTFEHPDGRPCGSPPLKSGRLCYWHEPEKSEEAAEARRLGGLRRRREKTVANAYDFAGLGSVANVRRVLEVAAIDTLGLENSVARTRALIGLSLAAARLLEVEELASYRGDDEDV